jgi:hypothetical protein
VNILPAKTLDSKLEAKQSPTVNKNDIILEFKEVSVNGSTLNVWQLCSRTCNFRLAISNCPPRGNVSTCLFVLWQ